MAMAKGTKPVPGLTPPMGSEGLWGRVGFVCFWVFPVVFASALIIVFITKMPSDLAARRGDGITGSYTVTRIVCTSTPRGFGKTCSPEGDFTSDDGRVHLSGIFYEGARGLDIGQPARALYVPGNEDNVYFVHGSRAWTFSIEIFFPSVAYLLYAAWCLIRWRRGKPLPHRILLRRLGQTFLVIPRT